MAKDSPHQTNYTRQINHLLAKIYGRSAVQDSLLDQAVNFFTDASFRPSVEANAPDESDVEQMQRVERSSNLLALSRSIIALAEGNNFAETNRKSAQLLGTIQLLSPTEGKKVAASNERSKSLYKAVLCLRLLDHLIINEQIEDSYINKFLTDISPEQYKSLSSHDIEIYQRFVDQVKIPLIMAALLQDIGNYHPKAQLILYGEEGKLDPFRTLAIEQRKELLQINYRETLKYLTEGVGVALFSGNTKAERERFLMDEQDKLSFITRMLKTSVNPKKSIGNVLKVPQIYTSIILSTKANYNYKLLPQVYQVLHKNAELGACEQYFVDALYKVTGMFPQGYGIVYMPVGEFGDKADCYEYAIVNSLYPKKSEHAACRITTRKLTFIGYGQNIVISNDSNLYFTETAKKLASLSKERLHEILELLSSNLKERKELDLLPRCWHAHDFFTVKANQNLWNKAEK